MRLTAADPTAGVTTMLRALGSDGVLPLYSQDGLTCYVVHGTPAHILSVTSALDNVKYSFPIPSTIKLVPGLFKR
jgi:hypothetical protein